VVGEAAGLVKFVFDKDEKGIVILPAARLNEDPVRGVGLTGEPGGSVDGSDHALHANILTKSK
jgi:hypothetical protein